MDNRIEKVDELVKSKRKGKRPTISQEELDDIARLVSYAHQMEVRLKSKPSTPGS